MDHVTVKRLRTAQIIFWDFDGVIKDSVMVKSIAFEQLFLPYGRELAERIRKHHYAHEGLSRYEKIPTYLHWVGEPATKKKVQDFYNRFSKLVRQAVIEAPWVPGVYEYLMSYHARQSFVLVTATPQEEVEQILCSLDIAHCFREVYGAPTSKVKAIFSVLQRWQCPSEQTLMIGDSETDLNAAEANNVPFLLRRTTLNQTLCEQHSTTMFEDLNHG